MEAGLRSRSESHQWEFGDEKLWRAAVFRDPAEALRAAEIER
jgi:hypothetical protein